MSAVVGALAVIGIPVVALLVMLHIADALQRRRAVVIARQIAVTDAIHREFGAVVAPTVRRTRGWQLRGGWRVTLPLDPRHPSAARIVELASATLGPREAVDVRSRRPFAGRDEPVVEVVVVAPSVAGPRRRPLQNKERIASAMSA